LLCECGNYVAVPSTVQSINLYFHHVTSVHAFSALAPCSQRCWSYVNDCVMQAAGN